MEALKDHFEYWFGQIVYLKTDGDQHKRIVTGINIRPHGVSYALCHGNTESWHYAFEITSEVDVLIRTTN